MRKKFEMHKKMKAMPMMDGGMEVPKKGYATKSQKKRLVSMKGKY